LATAEFILDFLAIHPFHDGNGRAARLLSTYLLERSGYHFARFYPVDNIILENREAYYDALFSSQRRWYQVDEDLTPWVEFYTDVIFNQYVRAFQRVKDARVRQR
jgi:Fic family protein